MSFRGIRSPSLSLYPIVVVVVVELALCHYGSPPLLSLTSCVLRQSMESRKRRGNTKGCEHPFNAVSSSYSRFPKRKMHFFETATPLFVASKMAWSFFSLSQRFFYNNYLVGTWFILKNATSIPHTETLHIPAYRAFNLKLNLKRD